MAEKKGWTLYVRAGPAAIIAKVTGNNQEETLNLNRASINAVYGAPY